MHNKSSLFLSICIPAYGRLEHIRNTLKSIYSSRHLEEVDFSSYEVIVCDNDKKASLKVLCDEFKFPNFHYFNTNCEGFMNSYHVLTYGRGKFLKLHNSQELWNPGSLPKIIDLINDGLKDKPLLFFTSGLLKRGDTFYEDSFDGLLSQTFYLSSWSNAFGIWKEDFDKISSSLSMNQFFPHTSLLLTQAFKTKYVICDQRFFTTQFVKKRGGHNKFLAFSVEYPSIIDQAFRAGLIEESTKKLILRNVLLEYLPLLYFNVKIAKRETFASEGFEENIRIYFPKGGYFLVVLLSAFVPFKILWRKFKNRYVLKSEF
jgi:glycosyltransferase involved in cell wall biosynthesis